MCTKCPLPPGLLCHTLLLPGRVPGKILIAKDSGRLLQLELLTLYNERGLVERIEVVPYRLTRNLQVFLSSFGVEVCRLAVCGR
jgi:transformation/transcription domain-associated protein